MQRSGLHIEAIRAGLTVGERGGIMYQIDQASIIPEDAEEENP